MKKALFLLYIMMCAWAIPVVAQKHLFRDEVKSGSEYPYVYNFLEEYFGQLQSFKDFSQLSRRLKDDKVVFLVGSPLEIDQLSDVLPFRLERVEDSYYIASWKDLACKDLITVSFPISPHCGQPQTKCDNNIRPSASVLPSLSIRNYQEMAQINMLLCHYCEFYVRNTCKNLKK